MSKQSRYRRYNAESRGLSFVGTVAAIVAALLIVSSIGWGVWYTQIRRPYLAEMHDAEVIFSIRFDGLLKCKDDVKEAMTNKRMSVAEKEAVCLDGEVQLRLYNESEQAFRAKYGRDPRYLIRSER